MNSRSLKAMVLIALRQWNRLFFFQRVVLSALAALVLIAAVYAVYSMTREPYVPFYPNARFEGINAADIKSYLQNSAIPYKMEGNTIFIPEHLEGQVANNIAATGVPKVPASKGWDLFDSTTWIKGEKELQILELRALKGQLEQDITQFNDIRGANVILEIPPSRPFGMSNAKPKASIILNIKPGTKISSQEIKAITYHVVGAIRGLDPNMVAISDTTGRLYQSIDPNGDTDGIRTAELAAEEHLKAKIDAMLATIVGFDNYFTTVQVLMNRDKVVEERRVYTGNVNGAPLGSSVVISSSEGGQQSSDKGTGNKASDQSEENEKKLTRQMAVPMDHRTISTGPGKIETISIGVLINEIPFLSAEENPGAGSRSREELRKDIENQLSVILKGYNVPVNQSVDFLPFTKPPEPPRENLAAPQEVKTAENPSSYLWLLGGIALLAAAAWLLAGSSAKKKNGEPKPAGRPPMRENQEQGDIEDLENILERIRARIVANPKESASVLEQWLRNRNPGREDQNG